MPSAVFVSICLPPLANNGVVSRSPSSSAKAWGRGRGIGVRVLFRKLCVLLSRLAWEEGWEERGRGLEERGRGWGRRGCTALSGVLQKCGCAGALIMSPVCEKWREGFSLSGGRMGVRVLFRKLCVLLSRLAWEEGWEEDLTRRRRARRGRENGSVSRLNLVIMLQAQKVITLFKPTPSPSQLSYLLLASFLFTLNFLTCS